MIGTQISSILRITQKINPLETRVPCIGRLAKILIQEGILKKKIPTSVATMSR